MNKIDSKTLLILFFLVWIIGLGNQAQSASNWYNTSWSKRKAITITGSTGGAQTDYQIKTTVSYDSDMQPDFDDVRFTNSDGVTLLNYWLESKTDSSTADFWVKVPSIPASPNTTIIYMYYGNSSASSTSSGNNTFPLFDDFNDRWLVDVDTPGEHPIIHDNKVYMVADGLWIIDLDTGEVLHHYLSGHWYYCAPVIDNEDYIHVYSANTGFIKKVAEATGTVDRDIDIGKIDFESLTYDSVNHRLIVMASGGLKAINTSDYSVQWTNPDVVVATAMTQSAIPIIVGDYVYARSNSNGKLYRINLSDGTTASPVDGVALPGNGARYATLVYDSDHDYIYAFEHSECNVYAVKADTLDLLWTKNLGNKNDFEIMYGGLYHANRLILPVREEALPNRAKLYALDVTDNGDTVWTNTTAWDNGASLINGALDDDYVYIPTHDYGGGSYHKLLVITNKAGDENDGKLYTTYEQNSNGSCSSLVASGGKVVLGLWTTEQAQMIQIRSAGDSLDMLYKVDQYRTGYLGTRLSGEFLDDPNTKWTNSDNFNIQEGALKKDVTYNPSFFLAGIAMSSDGVHQTAVAYGGYIYVSTDYGNTWTQKGSSQKWLGIAMSDTGLYQTAVTRDGPIYVSIDSGNTWNPKDETRYWSGVAMSDTGQYQTAVVYGGNIYVSTDYGNTWNPKDEARYWSGVAMSSTGQYRTAVINYGDDGGGDIYVSNDSGVSWTGKENYRYWRGIAMSKSSDPLIDGKYQTAIADGDGEGDYIYVSDDFGESLDPRDSPRNWRGIAMSSDGKYQTATDNGNGDNGYIYVSSDSGVSWDPRDSPRDWRGIAMSSDGKYQTAIKYPDQIYISTNYGNNWDLSGFSSYGYYLFTSTDTFAYPLAVEAKAKVGSDWSDGHGWNFAVSWDSDWQTTGYFSGHYKDASSNLSALKKFSSLSQTNSDETSDDFIVAETWYRLSLLIGSSDQGYNVDDDPKAILETSPSEDPTNIILSTSRPSFSGYTTYFDWVFVRNYTSPEPSTSIGSEITLHAITITGQIILNCESANVTDVLLTLSGETNDTTNPNTDGNYSLVGLQGGNYTVTPSLEGFHFFPTSYSYTPLNSDKTNQNFIGWYGASGDEGQAHCFIATATFGTPMAEEVKILSQFRDEYLLTNPIGKTFVNTYYNISPYIANFIREHPVLKKVVRTTLYPLIWMSEKSIE